ncbi:hypothetical protein CL689_05890 [Candidatus Saccharibacteria bacterium]|nr:hypothetical protein [Candidatus Saccharibacteria bacterium]MBQ69572.1 hypothetical protein [Candidatus Saccharibacteria bacterium]
MNELIGLISLAIAVISYSLYITHTLKGYTKPHAITWLVWGLLNGSVFFEQLAGGAGPGAWVTAAAAVANLFIFGLALRLGERTVTRFDWVCLALVGVLLLTWALIADPVIVVFLAITIFLLGLFPTLRKSATQAHEETASTYALNGFKFFLALLALNTITVTTALYPLVLFLVNCGFALYLVVARYYQGKAVIIERKGTLRGRAKKTRRR